MLFENSHDSSTDVNENLWKKKLSIELEPSSMYRKIVVFIAIVGTFIGQSAFAAPMSYEEYKDEANFCDAPAQPWNATNRTVAKLIYPQLDTASVNSWMQSAPENESSNLGKQALREALNPARIGALS